ncbi:phenylalanine--tRNA ligase subunit beta [Halobacteriales archaeon SW_7_68_16]|nr:MAG: phenylalanine--tRNA ligase subunit beta [Halobacteriales archaeon SW_7_68_16]
MPVVEVDYDELRRLTGHDEKEDADLRADLFELGIEHEGDTEDGAGKFEFESDRLDRLSVEGIARSLRYQYADDRGVYVPPTNDPDWTIRVEDVPPKRPYVTGAVVRGVDLDEAILESLIQLQEKLHATMGRGRAKGAIGIHDLTMLKGAAATDEAANVVRYTGIDPDGDRFVPLDDDAERTPGEVLAEHPVGETYADLVADYERLPAIYDEIGLFSFPPVINGRRTEVTTDSRNLFVELTGTEQWTIDRMCAIVCYALDARGGRIESVRVEYDDGRLVRPDFEARRKRVTHERIESTLGIELSTERVVDLLERSGLDADAADGTYTVSIPPYRVDVLHPADVVDDVGRAYGFNRMEPHYPDVSTVGGRHDRSRLERAVRTRLVGLGFEDMLNFHMTSPTDNYERMRIEPGADCLGGDPPATIREPYSSDYEILRTWALPSLLAVLSNNTHRRYPQDLAEIGLAAGRDDEETTGVAECRTVAAVLARTDAGYEDAKARLAALCRTFDADLETPLTEHPSFVPGRVATVRIDGVDAGVIGEVHPAVLVDRDVEVPVAGFEFRLDALDG